MLKTITAKFASKCAATGAPIKKGDVIQYDTETKKAYKEGQAPPEENDLTGAAIQANEDAYFDRFCYENNM